MGSKADIPEPPARALDPDAVSRAFDVGGRLRTERNRWFAVASLLATALIILLLIFSQLLPLRQPVPYIVRVNDNGEVTARPQEASQLKPSERMIRFFLGRWVQDVFILNPHQTVENLKKAYYSTRAQATSQFEDLVSQLRPIERLQEDPTLRASVEILSVNFLPDNAAVLRFQVRENSAEFRRPRLIEYSLSVTYVIESPNTVEGFTENPLGLYQTNFNLTKVSES